MPKPLHLFIRPPYQPTDTPAGPWTRVYSYGVDETASGATAVRSHTLLRSSGDARVRAAAAGKISMRPPGLLASAPTQELDPIGPDEPLPDTINFYLHISPATTNQRAFRNQAAPLSGLEGFAYFNIETASLETTFGALLDGVVQPPGSITRSEIVNRFVRGVLDLPVKGGQFIGVASTTGAPTGTRQVGFAAQSQHGPVDPSHVYDWMRDFVEDSQLELDQLLALMPKRWPLIGSNLGRDEAIDSTRNALYPMPVLEELRNRLLLSRAEWRQVGNNQKRLFQNRLLRRVGHWSGENLPPAFEFDDADWRNIFQLEAVAEFYANFDDPWKPGAQPRFLMDPAYILVDFLDLEGEMATVSGNVVMLDGNPPLDQVWVQRDTLVLESDVNPARQGKTYKITKVNPAAGTVSLDGTPILTGGLSRWKIRKRPTVVLIDSFGARLKGKGATVSGTAGNVITLGGTSDLGKINPHFDTVYLPSDTARGSRTYRITHVDATARTLTLDGNPVLDSGSSAWQIPGGIGGEVPAFDQPYNLGPNNPPSRPDDRGNDHYDGAAFVIDSGSVKGRVRFSSFTSRAHPVGDSTTSSVRGNRRYQIRSFRSGKAFLNYCFKVEDPGRDDTVAEARHYFPEKVTRDLDGKKLIRLHRGNRSMANSGSNSEGCLVSPSFYELRMLLIDAYQDEYQMLHAPAVRDAEVGKAAELDHEKVLKLYGGTIKGGLSPGNWSDKIFGTLWLIRPEERPIT